MFSVSTKTQYGIRALVHLARSEEESLRARGRPGRSDARRGDAAERADIATTEVATSSSDSVVTAAAIAAAENISPKYLEGILSQLTTVGLLVSERGKRGGYRLARQASAITMLEIVEALEGEIRPVGCVDSLALCSHGQGCLPRRFWLGLKDSVDGYLSSRTLRDILDA